MEDCISVYCNELISISNDIISLRENLFIAQSIIETGWKGKSGTAADEKVESLKHCLSEAYDEIERAANYLSGLI